MTSRRSFLRGLVGACCGVALVPRILPLLEPVAPVVDPLQFVTFQAIKRIADAMRYEFCVEPFGLAGHYKLIMAGDAIEDLLTREPNPFWVESKTVPPCLEICQGV